tara:strand:+ start:1099 stop:1986 length:888 start_codon:yes stop_codon:yes gene_type:complete
MQNYFKGSIPAVITPFTENLEIDFDALEKHIKFLISNGVHGLVSCGTTGESPTLTHDEHKLVTEKIMTFSKRKVPVMSGCGSNSTIESIDLVNHSESIGVDAILLVTPYYNKPTQRGIVEHFKLIAKKTNLPIYLYNIPSRSVANIDIETLKKLSKIKNIVGVKDATADLTYPLQTFETCGGNFIQLSGEDATFLSFLVSGGSGCISVSANVIPKLHSQLYNYWYSGQYQKAMNINHKIFNLNKVLFLETSPAPVKYALSLTNGYNPNLRLPLVELEDSTKKKVKMALKKLKLIS